MSRYELARYARVARKHGQETGQRLVYEVVSALDPLARTVEIRARTAGRWWVRGLVSRTRSIVPSSGSRCPGPSVVSWAGTRLAARAEIPMPAAAAAMRPLTPRQR